MTKERLELCNELKHILSELDTFEISLYSETRCVFKDHLLVGIKDELIKKLS